MIIDAVIKVQLKLFSKFVNTIMLLNAQISDVFLVLFIRSLCIFFLFEINYCYIFILLSCSYCCYSHALFITI